MEQKRKPFNKGGRKPKLDPRTHRYSPNLDDVENAKFLAFYDQSLQGKGTFHQELYLWKVV